MPTTGLALAIALVALPLLVLSPAARAEDGSILSGEVKRLDGSTQDLGEYRGRVVLIVNTASECGFTPQYAGLEELYQRYAERGLVILGFPSNDFGEQEPGDDDEIREFCRKNYGVTFPMFSKVRVKGAEVHPLYARLTGLPAPLGGEIEWNFQKFLFDRSGRPAARFSPRTEPLAPSMTTRIEALLDG